MRKETFPTASLAWLLACTAHADLALGSRTRVVFATVDEGRRLLGQRDEFIEQMSPFDRMGRMKTDRPVTEAEFLSFVRTNVLPWTAGEEAPFSAAVRALAPKMKDFALPFPDRILLVKATGSEEADTPYTRTNAIVFPQSGTGASGLPLQRTLCHELFHILTRCDPGFRERMYGAIGFQPCDEPEFPENLREQKLTNPDAPRNNHLTRVTYQGREVSVIPILISNVARYDRQAGGTLFDYLQCRLLVVEPGGETGRVKPLLANGKPVLAEFTEVSGFYEQVGRNTEYVIHPEEILADNFELLVLGRDRIRSPEVLERMRRAMPEAAAAKGQPR